MWSTGINRNIVECKGTSRLRLMKRLICINRNIVECKDYGSKWFYAFIKSGINRNIVECKVKDIASLLIVEGRY